MACGVIPIVTPMVGDSEIAMNETNGYVIRSSEELIEILKNLDHMDLDKLRRKAIATARKILGLT